MKSTRNVMVKRITTAKIELTTMTVSLLAAGCCCWSHVATISSATIEVWCHASKVLPNPSYWCRRGWKEHWENERHWNPAMIITMSLVLFTIINYSEPFLWWRPPTQQSNVFSVWTQISTHNQTCSSLVERLVQMKQQWTAVVEISL